MDITREMSKILSTSTAITTDAEISAYNYLSQGTASATYLNQSGYQPGLVLLTPTSAVNGTVSATGAVTFTGATSVSLNGVFSNAYENYKIILKVRSSAAFLHVNVRFRASGSDESSANYQGRTLVWGNDGGFSSESRVNDTSMLAVWNQGLKNSLVPLDIGSPNLSETTSMVGSVMNGYIGDDTNMITSLTGGLLRTTTVYDGLTFLINPSYNMTGTVRVYGYRN